MVKRADVSTKKLISLAPDNWVKWVTQIPDIVAGEILDSEFQVINLWEVDVNIVFNQPLPSLLPFVPILQGGENESTIREALQILRADEQLNQLETVLAFFATFVLDSTLVQEIMRWDMAVLRESPWYQEIEQRGVERGRRENFLGNIATILEVKFGREGLELMPQITQVSDLDRLQEILRSIVLVSTIAELRDVL
ncbi:MAG: hypothetical protein AB3A66_14940 [Nodularia sp. CChRGM 3473]